MKPLIHKLYDRPMSGPKIEESSFAVIDGEAPTNTFSADEWEVVRRIIHTTADFSLMDAVRFSDSAISSAVEALSAGQPVYTDSNMIRAGISLDRLRGAGRYDQGSIFCHVADPDVAEQARRSGLPRSMFAVRKAAARLDGGIAVFGNAPVGLLELNRLIIEEGVRPALVIAAPVGFVHVVESKEELMGLDAPFIAVEGRRGGSPIAVSILHALCGIAARGRKQTDAAAENGVFDAVIILGHGSRVENAGRFMEAAAAVLRERGDYPLTATCNMSRRGPHFEEVFKDVVNKGAHNILLVPYFLHEGLHLKLDVPRMMQDCVRDYPEVKLVLGKPLGFDPLLVDLLGKRIEESIGLEDVRELPLPDEDDFPLPPGQFAYVPMSPLEAAEWKEGSGEKNED
jgi:precorrin-8X/cobalt-precorrin-8 methylmutase